MRILVDRLPITCGECQFCAKAMVMSELGVQKEVELCTIQMSLIPPASPQEEPNFLQSDKSPKDNQCPCIDYVGFMSGPYEYTTPKKKIESSNSDINDINNNTSKIILPN